MKKITEYFPENSDTDFIYNNSLMADFAIRLYINEQNQKKVNEYYIETATSYLSMRRKIIENYDSLYKCNAALIVKPNDIILKKEYINLTFEIIVSSKILLDLFVCLVRTILFGNPFLNNGKDGIKVNPKYVDISHNGFLEKNSDDPIQTILNSFPPEFKEIRVYRNHIIHKGYLINFDQGNDHKVFLGKSGINIINEFFNENNEKINAKFFAITVEYTSIYEIIDIDLIACKIFITLPEIEGELLKHIEKRITVDKSIKIGDLFVDLKKIKIYKDS